MAQWHLQELRVALEQRGWRLISEQPGDDNSISAYWHLQRSVNEPTLVIGFEGQGQTDCLPLSKSYGCFVVGEENIKLYFKRRSQENKERHQQWQEELQKFIGQMEIELLTEGSVKTDNSEGKNDWQ